MRTSGRPGVRKSRWLRLSAGLVITPPVSNCRQPSIHAAIFSSHDHCSRSSSGWAECILAMSGGGWSSPPSWNNRPSRWASAVAIVVLPLPETPATMRIARNWPTPGCPAIGVDASALLVVALAGFSAIALALLLQEGRHLIKKSGQVPPSDSDFDQNLKAATAWTA